MSFTRCCLLLIFFNSVTCYNSRNLFNTELEYDQRFALWPSLQNGAVMMVRRRRDVQDQKQGTTEATHSVKPSIRTFPHEGGHEEIPGQTLTNSTTLAPQKSNQNTSIIKENDPTIVKYDTINSTHLTVKGPATFSAVENPVETKNITKVKEKEKKLTPVVLMRGLTVFSFFLFIAMAYFFFHRKRNKINETNIMHNMNDTNQFRYGVLQSDDRRDNMELSHVPLTMESDDEDDEDLEIFDLGQKKKTASYLNLQQNDEELVFDKSREDSEDKDNLLLDIEEGPSDTLINWSNHSCNSDRPML